MSVGESAKKTSVFSALLFLLLVCGGCRGSRGIYENIRGKHLILENGAKRLFWFSGVHSNDPTSPMFDDLRAEILKENPSYMLVEGGFNARTYASGEEAKLGGESAYASYVARELDIPCGDIEPSDAETNAHLLKNHSAESILAMYVIRQMHQVRRESESRSVDYDDYFLDFINSDIRDGLPEFDPGEKTIADLIEPYVGYRVDQDNWRHVNTSEVIYRESGKLHRVWQDAYQFRNIHALELLERLYRSYDRIFVVMGFDHARDLSSELNRLFKKMG